VLGGGGKTEGTRPVGGRKAKPSTYRGDKKKRTSPESYDVQQHRENGDPKERGNLASEAEIVRKKKPRGAKGRPGREPSNGESLYLPASIRKEKKVVLKEREIERRGWSAHCTFWRGGGSVEKKKIR